MFKINIGEMMRNRTYLTPDKEGFIGRKRYTFKDMNERMNQFAHHLQANGVVEGERIALICKNHEDFITAFFGAAKLGVITVAVNCRLEPNELSYIIENSDPTMILYDEEFTEKMNQIDISKEILLTKVGTASFDEVLRPYEITEPKLISNNDDTALIIFTSGTTGKPKGAMLTHENLYATSVGMTKLIDWRLEDRFLSVAPFFHIGGIAPMITNMHFGCTSILMKDFHPVSVWETIEKEKVTTMMAVPAMLQLMSQVKDQVNPDYSSIRNISVGAAPVPESLVETYDQFGIALQQVYGITEYSGAVAFWVNTMGKDTVSSAGKMVFHGEVKIVDPETKEELGVNEVGELVISGPQVFKGYWRNEKETHEVLKGNNYFTEDIGKIDENGFVYVLDRLKDMIISGGENIYTTELEFLIQSHPSVVEVSVVGIPDDKWGEIPKAFIVATEGSNLTEEVIINLCKESLASYKAVKEVEFIDELPRNGAGKVMKPALIKRHSVQS